MAFANNKRFVVRFEITADGEMVSNPSYTIDAVDGEAARRIARRKLGTLGLYEEIERVDVKQL